MTLAADGVSITAPFALPLIADGVYLGDSLNESLALPLADRITGMFKSSVETLLKSKFKSVQSKILKRSCSYKCIYG